MIQVKKLQKIFVDRSDKELLLTAAAAVVGGNMAFAAVPTIATAKTGDLMGFRALETQTDLDVQNKITEYLSSSHSDAFFILEEKNTLRHIANKIITPANMRQHLLKTVYGVDAIDGTTQWQNELFEWGSSVGSMQNLVHQTGALYCPDIRGGLLVCGARKRGVYLFERDGDGRQCFVAKDKPLKSQIIHYGVDMMLSPEYNRFMNTVSNSIRCSVVTGSCALGLALVASGKIDAFVQVPQRVWDWFGGYPLVLEAGGAMKFYTIENGSISPIKKLEAAHYDPSKKEVGFVAGSAKTVDRVFAQLVKLYNSM